MWAKQSGRRPSLPIAKMVRGILARRVKMVVTSPAKAPTDTMTPAHSSPFSIKI